MGTTGDRGGGEGGGRPACPHHAETRTMLRPRITMGPCTALRPCTVPYIQFGTAHYPSQAAATSGWIPQEISDGLTDTSRAVLELLRTCRDDNPQASTLVHRDPCPGGRNTPPRRHTMRGRLAAQGTWPPPQTLRGEISRRTYVHWELLRKGMQRKWFVCGVEANGAYDWVTAAKNTGKLRLPVEEGEGEFEATWRREDKLESDHRHERLLRREPPIGESPSIAQQQTTREGFNGNNLENGPLCSRLGMNARS